MIPLQLTIRGLSSYQKEHHIDFERLLEGQLFGIFGPVGSGKSTLLEAMVLAMYGDTDRLNRSGDNRNYNLMNLKSDELLIDFQFVSGVAGRTYRCIYKAKRNKKHFDRVMPPEHSAYVREKGEWVPIPIKQIEEAVGLNYANFKRTVIIPQGKFQEFLQLGPTDRTKMLQHIFGLDKFDLRSKVKSLKVKNDLALKEKEGGLQQFEQIDETFIISLRKEQEVLQTELQKSEERGRFFKSIAEEVSLRVKIQFRIARLRETLTASRRQLKERNETIQLLTVQFEQTKRAYEALGKARREVDGLIRIIELKKVEKDLDDLQQQLQAKQQEFEQLKHKSSEIREKLKILEKEQTELQSRRKNLKQLTVLDTWFKDRRHLYERKIAFQEEIEELTLAVEAKLEEARKQNDLTAGFTNFEDGLEWLQLEKLKLEQSLDLIREEEKHLAIRDQLDTWATALKDGEQCPLCGSKHHPEIFDVKDTAKQMATLLKRSKELLRQLQIVRANEEKWVHLRASSQSLNDQKRMRIETLDKWEDQLTDFDQTFPQGPYTLGDEQKVQKELEDCLAREEAFDLLSKRVGAQREALDNILAELQKIERSRQALSEKQAASKARRSTLRELFEEKTLQKYDGLSQVQIKEQIQQLKDQIRVTETAHQDEENRLHTAHQHRNNLIGAISTNESHLAELHTELKQCEALMQEKIQSSDDNWAVDWAREMNYELFQQKLMEVERQWEQAKEAFVKLEGRLVQAEKDIATKERLQKEWNLLVERAGNIQVLTNLFKGNGFVEYISSIYLQELCEAANDRFYRLTRQRLRLEVNDKNQFIVRDLLNQGKTRSAKTLSGGQLFQASLSLALALAENVRRQNGLSQQFFFIDEGFGTQDEESLQLVINTLKSLRKEGRAVGVISHLQALQGEIDVFLTIQNDELEGSTITKSWEV